jgi:hypothetical protein
VFNWLTKVLKKSGRKLFAGHGKHFIKKYKVKHPDYYL